MPSFLETQPYKGTRDFYPLKSMLNLSNDIDLKEKQNYIFETLKTVLLKNNFSEYSSSIIESTDAFVIKSGGDLAGKQLYNFVDKGDRNITLRPELTLSIARMVADKINNLRYPLRWFTIDNCFRYERPQKGRLREFWQAEVDIIGLKAGAIDLEILNVIIEIFNGFNATPEMYNIKYSHRALFDEWVKLKGYDNQSEFLMTTFDVWHKLKNHDEILKEKFSESEITNISNVANREGGDYLEFVKLGNKYEELQLIDTILKKVYPEVDLFLDPTIVRGQAYYTGLVFECFDKNPNNPRSLFGGGRFDNLLDLYGKELPAIGFAPGDVTLNYFLENWNLYPDFKTSDEIVGFLPKNIEDLEKIYLYEVPKLEGAKYEIDYDFDRSENKRFESLKKKGINKIIKL